MSHEAVYLGIMAVAASLLGLYVIWKGLIPELREKRRQKEVLRRGREAGK